jgi:endoglucanase
MKHPLKLTNAYISNFCEDITIDINGNLIAHKKGSGKHKIMIIGHADEIGFMVNYIDESGFIYVKALGGFDVNMLPGLRVDIHHNDNIVHGIIGKKPIHLLRNSDEPSKLKLEDLWIDIVLETKKMPKPCFYWNTITFSSQIEELNENYC